MGSSELVREHRTPAYKLVIGVDAQLSFACAGKQGLLRAVLVPPCVAQALTTEGLALGIFMEAGDRLSPFAGPSFGCQSVTGKPLAALLSLARSFVASESHDEAPFCEEAFRILRLAEQGAPQPDARVEQCLRTLRGAPNLPLASLARAAHLSPERLRHLVVAHTGMPLSEHRLLQRTTTAIELVLAGTRLAEAALEAGFADQAHFSRTFARLFGRTPSSVPKRAALRATWAAREDSPALP